MYVKRFDRIGSCRLTFLVVKMSQQSMRSSSRSSTERTSKFKIPKNKFRLIEICVGEFLGTAMLMFFGCASLVPGYGPIPSLQPGLMFGFVVSTVICIFGHISGAHLNPSVSVSAFLLEMISVVELGVYFLSQMLGAIIGVGMVIVITQDGILSNHSTATQGFCTTVPHSSLQPFQAFLAEFFATSLLIFTCCGVWDKRTAKFGDAVPIKFALVVTLCSVTIGPYTGASMNPARSFAPALYAHEWTSHWMYWVSPILASVCTTMFYKCFLGMGTMRANVGEKLDSVDPESRNPIN